MTNTARRRVLPRGSGRVTLVLVVALLPLIRYFIIVVTFTEISCHVVSQTWMRARSEAVYFFEVGDKPSDTYESQISAIKRVQVMCPRGIDLCP